MGNSCYISGVGVMGRPKDASGCHCVLSLCHLMYCHLPNTSPWRLRRFPKSQFHLQELPPISFVLPQLCAHDAFKIIKQLVTEFFFHSLCIRSSLHSTPCRPHRPFPGPLAIAVRSIHGGARGEELLHHGCVATQSQPVQRCQTSGAAGLGDATAGGLHPVALHWQPHLQWEKLQSVE